jgi:hypothetical protein
MRSPFEKRFANNLKNKGIEFQYEPKEFIYWIKLPRARTVCRNCSSSNNIWSKHTYTPDFYLPEYDVYLETKGRWIGKDRKKHKAMKQQYPDLKLAILFHSDSYLSKRSKTRYSMWCDKEGIAYKVIGKNAIIPSIDWIGGL